jgi:acetate kinase
MAPVLIFNAGSSSIKVSLFEPERERLLARAEVNWTAAAASIRVRVGRQPEVRRQVKLQGRGDAVAHVLAELQSGPSGPLREPDGLLAVGHRVVHGGERYTSAVRITPDVRHDIAALAELAPLHNAASLEVIDAARQLMPDVPQVAAFDTTFHTTLPEAAKTYAVPYRWTSEWGVRRYGFHGLSHSYCAARAAEMVPAPSPAPSPARGLRLVIAHLGNGASVSAVRGGTCVDTSMGFTPLDGLMMGTRSGSVDPGILIHVLRQKGMTVDQLDHALNHESGLLGVSGVASDMREVLAAAARGDGRARLAVDVYVHRIRQTIGAMAATLGGVDALVFTAGVGEHAPLIRQRACENLAHLGVAIDPAANAACEPDADVASRESGARIFVIATREDLAILRQLMPLVQPGGTEGERP